MQVQTITYKCDNKDCLVTTGHRQEDIGKWYELEAINLRPGLGVKLIQNGTLHFCSKAHFSEWLFRELESRQEAQRLSILRSNNE